MITLQKPGNKRSHSSALIDEPKVNSAVLEHYLYGQRYPASKQEVLNRAMLNKAPENVMAFYINRLPIRQYKNVSDVSFTAFVSSYFFGQD